jgi:hypothetical protein
LPCKCQLYGHVESMRTFLEREAPGCLPRPCVTKRSFVMPPFKNMYAGPLRDAIKRPFRLCLGANRRLTVLTPLGPFLMSFQVTTWQQDVATTSSLTLALRGAFVSLDAVASGFWAEERFSFRFVMVFLSCLNRICGPPSLVSNGYRGLFSLSWFSSVV